MPKLSSQIVSFGPPRAGIVAVTHADRTTFLEEITEHLKAREGFTVATINLDHVVKLRDDAAFRAAYLAHSHIVADGNPIVWLSRLAGRSVDLIPGSELVDPLCAAAANAGVSVALLGSTEEVLVRAGRDLETRHEGLRVALRIAPPMGFDPSGPDVADMAERIAASGSGLCFLALGAPKQERLAVRLAEAVPFCGFVSVGAGIDFVAGQQARAPVWVRQLALEWVWRMAGDPRRLAGRYAACLAVLPGLSRAALRSRH